MPGQNFFTRVSDTADKKKLLEDLVRSRTEIQAKIPEQEIIHITKAFEFNGKILSCVLPASLKTMEPSGSMIFSFFIGGEKYFMDATYKILAGDIVVSIPENIFHLQRRDHYRIHIPPGFSALLEATAINGKLYKVTVPLLDLSAGGCKIQLDVAKLTFGKGDEIKGHLFLSDREPIPVTGKIRYSRKNPADKFEVWAGVQFIGLSEKEKNRIGSLVMDLYREFFAKYR